METIAVVLKQPKQVQLDRLVLTDPPTKTSSSMSNGAASAPAPSGRCGRDGCRLFPAWVIRWSPATSWSVTSSRPDLPAASVPASACSFPAQNVSARYAACSALPLPAWWCGRTVWCRSTGMGDRGILLALAATAYHAIAARGAAAPNCIVGHGVLGRLLARISMAVRNDLPAVWENQSGARERGNRAMP